MNIAIPAEPLSSINNFCVFKFKAWVYCKEKLRTFLQVAFVQLLAFTNVVYFLKLASFTNYLICWTQTDEFLSRVKSKYHMYGRIIFSFQSALTSNNCLNLPSTRPYKHSIHVVQYSLISSASYFALITKYIIRALWFPLSCLEIIELLLIAAPQTAATYEIIFLKATASKSCSLWSSKVFAILFSK